MRPLNLPDSPSQQTTSEDGKLFAPSAERNAQAIETVLKEFLPASGRVLELASGTGQHVTRFAQTFPDLHWTPSDPDAQRRHSILSYRDDTSCTNIADPLDLVATLDHWPSDIGAFDAIVLVNLLHLIATQEAQQLIQNVARALAPQGRFILYGPFTRADDFSSDNDRAFHASLISQDPNIGYKDDFDVAEWLMNAWLEPLAVLDMPANNVTFVAQKS